MKRAGYIKKKPRSSAEKQRIYGTPQRIAWLKAHPCLVCGWVPSENAHTANGGIGRKADADTIVPLCHEHHRMLHDHGATTFALIFSAELDGHTLADHAARIDAEWQAVAA